MSAFEAIVLGIVQGLTEFLPISSTAHLRIVPAFAGWEDPGAAFTAVTQLGTLAAVLLYFRHDLLNITRGFLKGLIPAPFGGAAGSGSTGASAMDAYDLHTGNGNNLSGYSNERIDAIISSMAVTSDPKEVARMLGEGGTILWADMPTLPLYRQQRTLVTSKKMYAVSSNPTRWGAGWNMDRWVLET